MQGPTWQQAVQYIQEVPLKDGERYTVTVKHDTYGLSFSLRSDTASTSLVPIASVSSHPSPPVPLYVSPCLSQIKVSGLHRGLAGAATCLAQPNHEFLNDAG